MENSICATKTVSCQDFVDQNERYFDLKVSSEIFLLPFSDWPADIPAKKLHREEGLLWEINFDCSSLLSQIIEDYQCCIQINASKRREEGIKKAKKLKEKRLHEAASRKSLRLTKPKQISLLNKVETISSSSSSLNEATRTAPDFSVQEEKRVWDSYYQYGKDADKVFTGFGPDTAVQIMRHLLGRRRIVFANTRILEIGHGLFPCASSLYHEFDTAGVYTGAEISSFACVEALRRCPVLQQLVADGSVEFVKVEGMRYFDEKGNFRATVLESSAYSFSSADFSEDNGDCGLLPIAPRLVVGSVELVLAKSTLDYFTCRLDKSGKMSTWEEDLRIPLCVVELFDSLSTAMCSPDEAGKTRGHLVFVEPSNEFKFRDHVLTIFKAIHCATFVTSSAARFLKLQKVCCYPRENAVGILLVKQSMSYLSYETMRKAFIQCVKHLYEMRNREDDAEYLFPLKEPPFWLSHKRKHMEKLVSLQHIVGTSANTLPFL